MDAMSKRLDAMEAALNNGSSGGGAAVGTGK